MNPGTPDDAPGCGRVEANDAVEALARIIAIEGDRVRIVPERLPGACPGCESGCRRRGLFGGLFAGERPLLLSRDDFRAEDRAQLAPDTRILLRLAERDLVVSSVVTYLLPLLGLVAGALLAEPLLASFGLSGAGDAPAVLGGGIGLVLAWWTAMRVQRHRLPRVTALLCPANEAT